MGYLNKYDKREKRALFLQKEMNRILKEMRMLGWNKLDKPIRNGWEVQWKLRDDIAKRKEAKYMQRALDAVKVTPVHCDNEHCFTFFKGHQWLLPDYRIVERSKKGLKVRLEPRTRVLHQSEYDKLDERTKKFFSEHLKISPWSKAEYKIYSLALTYELVPDIKRSYITHRRIHDETLEQEYEELYAEYDKYIYNGTLPARWKDWGWRIRHKVNRMKWKNAKTHIERGVDPDELEFEPQTKKDRW